MTTLDLATREALASRAMTGNDLRDIRMSKFSGLSQADMAAIIGVSKRTWIRLEGYGVERVPRRDYLAVLGAIFLYSSPTCPRCLGEV